MIFKRAFVRPLVWQFSEKRYIIIYITYLNKDKLQWSPSLIFTPAQYQVQCSTIATYCNFVFQQVTLFSGNITKNNGHLLPTVIA